MPVTTKKETDMDALAILDQHTLPFARLMGLTFTSAAKDKVTADTLGAAATFLNLPQGATTTTVESKTNFVAPAPAGTKVLGETTPIHRGRRTMIWQTRVTTPEGRLVALVTQTQMVLS